jgi:hypothetical protein
MSPARILTPTAAGERLTPRRICAGPSVIVTTALPASASAWPASSQAHSASRREKKSDRSIHGIGLAVIAPKALLGQC